MERWTQIAASGDLVVIHIARSAFKMVVERVELELAWYEEWIL